MDHPATGVAAAAVGGEFASPYDEGLISPTLTLLASDTALKFSWGGSKFWFSAVNPSVSIRQVGAMTWTEIWSLFSEPDADPFIYRDRIADITAYVGQDVEFRFRVSGTDGADFYLDDVEVGTFTPTAVPANDLCSNATVLATTFDVQDVTCYATNNVDPYVTGLPLSCVPTELGGQDVFYELTAAAGDTLRAAVSTADWGIGLYLVDDCATPVCLAGLYAEDATAPDTLVYEFPTSGTYYLVVDGETGSCGPYQLTGEIRPTAVGVIDPPRVLEDGLRLTVLPNPSSGVMLLRGRVPEVAAVASLAIYDIAGKEILDVEVPLSAGELAFQWDGQDARGDRVSAGTYVVRVRAGTQVLEGKITLVR